MAFDVNTGGDDENTAGYGAPRSGGDTDNSGVGGEAAPLGLYNGQPDASSREDLNDVGGGEAAPFGGATPGDTGEQPSYLEGLFKDVMAYTRDRFGLNDDQSSQTDQPAPEARADSGDAEKGYGYQFPQKSQGFGEDPDKARMNKIITGMGVPDLSGGDAGPGKDWPAKGGSMQDKVAKYMQRQGAMTPDEMTQMMASNQGAPDPKAATLEDAWGKDKHQAVRFLQGLGHVHDGLRAMALGAYEHGHGENSATLASRIHDNIVDGKALTFKLLDSGNFQATTVAPDGATHQYELSPQAYRAFLASNPGQFDHVADLGINSVLQQLQQQDFPNGPNAAAPQGYNPEAGMAAQEKFNQEKHEVDKTPADRAKEYEAGRPTVTINGKTYNADQLHEAYDRMPTFAFKSDSRGLFHDDSGKQSARDVKNMKGYDVNAGRPAITRDMVDTLHRMQLQYDQRMGKNVPQYNVPRYNMQGANTDQSKRQDSDQTSSARQRWNRAADESGLTDVTRRGNEMVDTLRRGPLGKELQKQGAFEPTQNRSQEELDRRAGMTIQQRDAEDHRPPGQPSPNDTSPEARAARMTQWASENRGSARARLAEKLRGQDEGVQLKREEMRSKEKIAASGNQTKSDIAAEREQGRTADREQRLQLGLQQIDQRRLTAREINAARYINSKINKEGVDALSEAEKQQAEEIVRRGAQAMQGAGGQPGGIPRPTSQAEYNAVPHNGQYIGRDGKTYTKK